MKKTMTLLTLGAALIAVPALAAPGGDRNRGDTDGDGVLTRAEAGAHATDMFAKMDANGDGKLDATDREAKKADDETKRGKRGGRHGMRGMMKADTDGDKAISQAEFQTAALARFDRMDADKDGRVTAEERKAAWAGMRAKRGAAPTPPAGE